MFYSTKSSIPFHSIKDVMRSYPDYKHMMRKGFEAYYIDYVYNGDQDYISFWERVKKNPQESVFLSIEQVLEDHEYDPVVIHDLQRSIDAYGKYTDPAVLEKLEIFYKGQPEYYSLIVTENSPLCPILRHGTKILFESGVIDYLSAKWLGGENRLQFINAKESSAEKRLDIQDMSLALSTYAIAVLFCFVIFFGEIIIFRKLWPFDFKRYLAFMKRSPDDTIYVFKERNPGVGDKLELEKRDNNTPQIKIMTKVNNNGAIT